MTTIKATLLSGFLLVTANSLANTYTLDPDEDTCWVPPDWCISVSEKWSEYTPQKFVVTYTNQCAHRIYLKMCNTKVDGSEDCGQSALPGGGTKNWYTYKANGRHRYKMIGVLKPAKDWVCALKVEGWSN